MNIEDKLIEFQKLANSIKLNWSICRFKKKSTFDIYVSAKNWESGFIISNENLSNAIDLAMAKIHNLYSN
jgi:hypothetical protein